MSSATPPVGPGKAAETTRLQSASMQDHGTMERPLLSKASSSGYSNASATRLDISDVPSVERVTSSIRSLAQASERTYRLLRLKRSLVCVALYVVVTVVMYGYVLEKWGWLKALYFASVTFTSVGTGDVAPSSDASRLFTTAYALFSICIVAVALAEIAESYRVQQAAHIRALKKTLITQLHKQHSRDFDEYVGAIQINELKQQRQNRQELRAVLMRALLPVFAVNAVGVTIIAAAERWSAIDAMYYAVVTSTTIGYGDVHPQRNLALGVAIVYIPLAVASVASAVSQVIAYLVSRADEERRTELLNKSFAWEAVFEMDTDHDNAVSELEYCLYMFELWGMVDKDVIRAVRRRFRELDVDGNGKLTPFDFMSDAHAFQSPGTAIRRATTFMM